MDTKRICPSCQKPLATDAPMGLCPECLVKAGFPTGVETDTGSGTQPGFVPPAVEEIARLFQQLEILELIGKGGMGAVYKARQKQLNRLVALKILPPGIGNNPSFAERFTREAQALAQLNHPGIVTLYEFGETSGQFYFLMEFVDGVNLRQLLQNGRVSAREALAIVPQICDALQFAHDQGIVHRDIKPENILLDRRGHVKVADFGLAKLVGAGNEAMAGEGTASGSPALTESGKIMGTPNYMAPEQKANSGEVDHRADIYALGVVFYQMLTGELPGKRIEPPSKRVHIDVRLDEVVLRALEKNPELRYQQASLLKTQIETIAATPGSMCASPAEPSATPSISEKDLHFFNFTIGLPLFAERNGRQRCYWPGVLGFCSTIGFVVCGVNLAIGLALWLLNVTLPHGNTFIRPDELWLWLVWLAFCAVGRLAALNLGADRAVRANFKIKANFKTSMGVKVFLVIVASAVWAYCFARFAGWLRSLSLTVLTDDFSRVVVWVVIFMAAGWFIIRFVWRAVSKQIGASAPSVQKPEVRYQQVSEMKTMVETIVDNAGVPPAEPAARPGSPGKSLPAASSSTTRTQHELKGQQRMHRPTSVTVFGILNIVKAGFGIFWATTSIALFLAPADSNIPFIKMLHENPAFAAWMKLCIPLGMLSCTILLVAGIGLLCLKSWARTLSIAYAIYATFTCILATAVNSIFLFQPFLKNQQDSQAAATAMFGLIGGVISVCLGLVYPILLLLFMLRPTVVAAFHPPAPPQM